MSVLDNGGFIGRTADYSATDIFSKLVSIELVASAQNLTDVSSYTFNITPTSTTALNEKVVIVAHGEGYNGTNTINSITYNSNPTTLHETTSQSGQVSNIGIASISGDGLSSATVVVNFSFQQYRAAIRVYRVYSSFGSIVYDSSISSTSATTSISNTLSTGDNSVIISGITHNNPGIVFSWTGATEQYDQDVENSHITGAILTHSVQPRTNYQISATTSAAANMVMALASFKIDGVTNKKNTGLWNLDSIFISKAPITVFTDTFETFTGWTTVGSGVLSQSSTQAYAGTYSAYKTTNGDPNGAYKLLDATVNREYRLEAWIFSEEPRAGGGADRISIVDASGNGYGYRDGGSAFGVETRTAYTGSDILGTAGTWTRPVNAWYRIVLEAKSDNTFTVSTYDSSGTLLGTYTSPVDTTHSGPFDRVAILGGNDYYVDNLVVKRTFT
jgi:hypothetical protein